MDRYISKLRENELMHLAVFVVKENFKHHLNNLLPDNYMDDILSIYNEEVEFYKNSNIIVIKNQIEDILGSIRILKWNFMDELPIQKIFEINPLLFLKDTSFTGIWHIGRFAIKKEIRDINLLKKLIACAISPICQHRRNFAFAECDSKLLRVISLMGIKAIIIGNSIDYLGSETIPVCLNYDGLIDFYKNNMELIPKNFMNQNLARLETNRL